MYVLLKFAQAKNSEVNTVPICLGNVSKGFSDNMKKTGLYGHVYDFSIDYDSTDVDHILDIYKYLIKENYIK